jgi:hypothetical protein
MTVRAKVRLTESTELAWAYPGSRAGLGARKLRFDCQYDDSIPEDMRFQKATPSGHIELLVENPAALAQMKLGHYYYVDFNMVAADEPQGG